MGKRLGWLLTSRLPLLTERLCIPPCQPEAPPAAPPAAASNGDAEGGESAAAAKLLREREPVPGPSLGLLARFPRV